MRLAHLWLTDFRCYGAAELEIGPGMTVLSGGNASGKTSILEAVGWLARMSSFRGAPDVALVRTGVERAFVRARDLLGTLRVTVFAPDDLRLVKGGPSERRAELDDLLVALSPRYDAARADYERALRHRNAWLKSWSRADDPATLDVWDTQLVRAGAELIRG